MVDRDRGRASSQPIFGGNILGLEICGGRLFWTREEPNHIQDAFEGEKLEKARSCHTSHGDVTVLTASFSCRRPTPHRARANHFRAGNVHEAHAHLSKRRLVSSRSRDLSPANLAQIKYRTQFTPPPPMLHPTASSREGNDAWSTNAQVELDLATPGVQSNPTVCFFKCGLTRRSNMSRAGRRWATERARNGGMARKYVVQGKVYEARHIWCENAGVEKMSRFGPACLSPRDSGLEMRSREIHVLWYFYHQCHLDLVTRPPLKNPSDSTGRRTGPRAAYADSPSDDMLHNIESNISSIAVDVESGADITTDSVGVPAESGTARMVIVVIVILSGYFFFWSGFVL
ncbi:hypothetical protein B0H19DRAFT_1238628 [Mycena capillaripes]|nr:hypothetical protein B0H19DRAFT_1238628 [Mycena capillaripes]